MGGQGQPPASALSEPAATPPEEAPAQSNDDILRSIMLGGGGSMDARPDPIGGQNHQGRALATLKSMAMMPGGGGK